MTPYRFSVSCGGTGGHVFPGLATARALQARGHEVTLWLAGKAIETDSRQDWSGSVVRIRAEGISASPFRLPSTLLAVTRAYRDSLRALRQSRPAVLLAMGSYSSVGPVLAAHRLGIPVVLHEANVVPGRAIDLLSRFAHTVAVAFPETKAHLPHRTLKVTGLPLRKDLEIAAQEPAPPHTTTTFLIMGGSQGAHRLNTVVMETVCALSKSGLSFNVLHLAGQRDREVVAQTYASAGVPHVVHGFLKDMTSAYRAASFAVCRAGANSCMELALFGVPALLVPYPEAARNHQAANARAMAATGAADMIEQRDLTPERLTGYLTELLAAPARLTAMRAAARQRAITGGDAKLADLIEEVAAGR